MSNKMLIGIDLGGTNVKMGLLSPDGTVAGRLSFPTQVENGPEDLIVRIAEHSRKLVQENQTTLDELLCVGMGSPGPLSVDKGQLFVCGNLPGYDNFKMRAALSSALNRPVVLHNDANAACWGEFWRGSGREVNDMVMFTLGTGVGGGIISAGELVRGSDDNGAELGHLLVVPDGRQCTCGQKGCVEAYASASQTALIAQEAAAENLDSRLNTILKTNGALTCKDVFDQAIAGDELAGKVTRSTARFLAMMCINMLHATEPEMVVFAGGMIEAGDYLLNLIRSQFQEMVWKLKPEPLKIEFATLGGDAGLIGAAGLALHALEQNKLAPIGE